MTTLITGATGFLGKECIRNMQAANVKVLELRKNAENENAVLERLDIRKGFALQTNESIEKVIHLAGKAHVIPKTEEEANDFYRVNYDGTANLLKALDHHKEHLKAFIFASTIAVYGVNEGENIKETFQTSPNTPYGKSKLEAEQLIIDWCQRNQVKFYLLRLPLIVGDKPKGNLKSIASAIRKGWYIKIKDNDAKKSMVLSEDISKLILEIEKHPSGIYNLTDGYHPSFSEIEEAFEKRLATKIKINLSKRTLEIFALIGDLISKIGFPSPLNTEKLRKITQSLTINDDKARDQLKWRPQSVLSKFDYLDF